jgi:hypothetical protein
MVRHYGSALIAAALEALLAGYDDDDVFITPSEIWHGKQGMRQGHTQLLDDLPGGRWEFTRDVFKGGRSLHRVAVHQGGTRRRGRGRQFLRVIRELGG